MSVVPSPGAALFFYFFLLGGGDGYITGEAGPSEGGMMELQDAASAFYSQLGHVPGCLRLFSGGL